MRVSIQKPVAAMIAAAIMTLVAFASAAAQTEITASNTSSCPVLLTLVDGSGNLAGPYLVPTGSASTQITLPAGFVPVGVEDVNGRTRSFVIQPPSPGCTPCIPLAQQGSNDFCCVTVCYDSTAQTITISACDPCQ